MKWIFTLLAIFCFAFVHAQSENELYKKANEFYDSADYASALKYVDLALQKDNRNQDYLFLKAITHDQLKDYKAAYDAYSELIEHNPSYAIAYNNRGLLLNKVQQFDMAIADFNTAINLGVDSLKLDLHINRGAAKVNKREFKDAYEDFLVCYAIDSLNIGTLNNLAAVCDEVGKGEQTLLYLHKILAIDSTFIGAWGNIGFKYQEMGEHARAIQYFDKVLSLQQDEPLGYSNRAFNKFKIKDIKGALKDINESIRLYPENSYAFRIRALIFLDQNKKTEACKDIEEALRLGFTQMYGEEMQELKNKQCYK